MSDREKLIVANCSGFYGDRLSAAAEMVRGGPIDVLTGDYLAELTMAMLFQKKLKRPETGYVNTFLKQMDEVMGECLQRGIKIVTNAGGLNPQGMAEALQETASRLGLNPKIAWIDGDDLMPRMDELGQAGETFDHLDKGTPLSEAGVSPVTANAYLGCWGIKEALDRGADIVVCPRVTDAAVVMGPAAWKFNWQRDDYDALAGALAAGHIIECGAQATGGNYAFFEEVPDFNNVGFPIAEMHADGSCVITKHPGTGGLVSVGTVTAQLLYEISAPEYLNPDVTGHFDTLRVEQDGPDRVLVADCKGSAPPPSHKVCINTLGGHRNSMTVVLTGLDIEEKARIVEDTLFRSLGGKEQFDEVDVQLVRFDRDDPPSNNQAFAHLRITVKDKDASIAGRLFSAKVVELTLANIPGFTMTALPDAGSPYILYWPALLSSKHITERVHIGDETIEVQPSQLLDLPAVKVDRPAPPAIEAPGGETVSTPLGRIYAARSGDKGGNANVGLWGRTPEAYAFLRDYLTVERLRELFPDLAPFEIERYEFANLNALNFNIRGLLGDGVSSSTRLDPQAKTLGEYLRARVIEAPAELL